MQIEPADISDAEEILAIQKLAFRIEAALYNDYDIPPLKQTPEELKGQFKDHKFLKAVERDRIVGSVRAYEEDGTCYIGRLAVLPELHNKGIGSALMREIESCFSPMRFELFVGTKSNNNIHFYKERGYVIFKTVGYGHGDIEIHFMEKEGSGRK